MSTRNDAWPPTWRADYEQILAGLPPRERRLVHDTVASGVIEGDIPDLKMVARLADVATGKITGDQYRAELLAQVRHAHPITE
ncbi:antitoxin VbhA family protein [Mycobacterium sp. SMC-18]|uniref:antitoxin VbhA family protein n=1 Tax=Mycobacterium sp. SMC-18 TaxID=3381629 RepID=UPI00387638B7